MKYTGWWGFYDLNPDQRRRAALRRTTGWRTRVSQGCFYYADRTRDQVNAIVTHYADKFGRHELKFGAEFEHSTRAEPLRLPWRRVLSTTTAACRTTPTATATTCRREQPRESLFAQDAWHVNDRLTINPGVRLDLIQGGNPSGGNVYSTKTSAPRLGVAYDVPGDYIDRRSKAPTASITKAAMAQIFERGVPGVSDYITYASTGGSPVEIDRDVNQPVVQASIPTSSTRASTSITSASNGRSAGTMRFTVTGIWRDNKNFINSTNPSARWTPIIDHRSADRAGAHAVQVGEQGPVAERFPHHESGRSANTSTPAGTCSARWTRSESIDR